MRPSIAASTNRLKMPSRRYPLSQERMKAALTESTSRWRSDSDVTCTVHQQPTLSCGGYNYTIRLRFHRRFIWLPSHSTAIPLRDDQCPRHLQPICSGLLHCGLNKLCGRPPHYAPGPASWPLTFWPWKWCPSHVWRGLPLCQF